GGYRECRLRGDRCAPSVGPAHPRAGSKGDARLARTITPRAHGRRRRRVRKWDELDARSALARLREEIHEVVDLARHILGHLDAELAQSGDVERVVVRPLARAELVRDALRVRLGVMLEQ